MSESQQLFTVGKVSVPINTRDSELIPEKFNFVVNQEIEETVENVMLGIKNNLPVLLVGPTGCGKTALVKHLAAETRNAYRRIQINGATDKESLKGHWLIRENGTYWVDGILTKAMREGEFLVLDELNAALPEVLFILHQVMDDDHCLTLDEKDGEIVHAHPDFRIFGTINPHEDYAGTKEMNRALVDRFPIYQEFSYYDAKTELKIVNVHTGMRPNYGASKALGLTGQLTRMMKVAKEVRAMNDREDILFPFSTRSLINWAKLTTQVGVKRAAQIVFINKADSGDREKILDIVNKEFQDRENVPQPELEAWLKESEPQFDGLAEQVEADAAGAETVEEEDVAF